MPELAYISFKWMVSPEASNIALIVTLLVLIAYTIETWKLRKASYKQIELSIQPLIISYYENKIIWIKNIGNGIALNIKVKNTSCKISRAGEIKIEFPRIETLTPGEKVELHYKAIFDDGSSANDGVKEYLCLDLLSFETQINYDNLRGEHYCSVVSQTKDGLIIKKNYKVKFKS